MAYYFQVIAISTYKSGRVAFISEERFSPGSFVPIISVPENTWYGASVIEKAFSHITTFEQTAMKAGKNGVPMHLIAGDESIKTRPAEVL